MIGIVSYGAYVPRYRMTGQMLKQAWGSGGKGERSVANHDEDSITMATESSRNCLRDLDSQKVEGLYFASTTAPYSEGLNCSLLGSVVDLKREIFTAEFSGSLRAGTMALRAGYDAVKAGTLKSVMVAAADLRTAEPGSPLEGTLGEGSGAFLIGKENVIAEIKGFSSISEEFLDVWRKRDDINLLSGDPKFISDYGYLRFVPESVAGIVKKYKLKNDQPVKVVFYAPDARIDKALAKKLKFPEEAYLKDNLLSSVGNTGTAQPYLSLIAALEEASPGDKIILASHGSGSDAVLLEVTENISRFPKNGGISAQLKVKRELSSYEKYLRFRRFLPTEKVRPFSSLMVLWREERDNVRLYAKKCCKCGSIQYPVRRVCWKCSEKDNFRDARLSTRGKIFTFTKDHLVPSPDLPVVMVSADLEGGGRFYTQLTDCDPEAVKVGMEVELTFRRFHEGEEFYNYFWKFRPVT